MKVIIHQGNSFLTKDKTIGGFIFDTITEMCKMQAGQAFVWLSYDNTNAVNNAVSVNHIMLKSAAFAGLWKQFWLNRKLRSVIKSQNPSCIVWLDEVPVKTSLPQCILVTQANNKPHKNVLHDVTIITLSGYLKQLLERRGYNPGRMHVMRPMVSACFIPADWDTRESTKSKYASGAEYFFLFATHTKAEQVLQLLKAFSLFKKWQKSAARLLIYTPDNASSAKWEKTLLSYKFYDDVIVQHRVSNEDRALMTASAMCVLYFPELDDTGLHIMECLQTQVPVITHNIGAITETAEEAALYCNGDNIEDIADKMKRIYRDEKLRTQLTAKMITIATKNTNNSSSSQLWHIIEKTADPNGGEAGNSQEAVV